MNDSSKIFEVAVGLIPGIGSMMTKHLVSYCGSAEEVFKSSKVKLKKIPNIGDVLAEQILQADVLRRAEQEITRAEKEGVKILFYTDKEYPYRLKQIGDAPALLYLKGKVDLNASRMIGIVGTRNATDYGKDVTEQIVNEFSIHQVVIVSGLAYGIDVAAHKAALKYNLPTIGVIASGIDIMYPAVHKQIAKDMCIAGGLLTENPYGTLPDAPRFPARNRIIAALSDALIISEASEKGGALITAEIANSYEKDIYAVPGKINDQFSIGCNKLILNHKAKIFTDINEIIKDLRWDDTTPGLTKKNKQFSLPELNQEQSAIYQILVQGEIAIDELAWKSQINVNKLSSLLLQMEFDGIIKAMPGKKFKLVNN